MGKIAHHCKFYDTEKDVMVCLEALEECQIENERELFACRKMFGNVLEYFEKQGVIEINFDALIEWSDEIGYWIED